MSIVPATVKHGMPLIVYNTYHVEHENGGGLKYCSESLIYVCEPQYFYGIM